MSQDSIHNVLFIARSHPQQVQSLIENLDNKNEIEPIIGLEQTDTIVKFVQEQKQLYSSILNCTKQLGHILLIQSTLKPTLNWNDLPVQWLILLIHQILKHGLKIKRNFLGYKKTYWDFIWAGYQYTPKTNSMMEDYPALANKIQSLSAQVSNISGIVFIVHSLVHQRLDQRLGLLLNQPQLLKDWYEPYAFILQDQMVLFNGLLVVLNNIKFDMEFQHEFLLELNQLFSGDSLSEVTLTEWLPMFEKKLKEKMAEYDESQSEIEEELLSDHDLELKDDSNLQDLQELVSISNHYYDGDNDISEQPSSAVSEIDLDKSPSSTSDTNSPPHMNLQLSTSVSPPSSIMPISPKGSINSITQVTVTSPVLPQIILPKLNSVDELQSIPFDSVSATFSDDQSIVISKSSDHSPSINETSPTSLPPDQISLPPSLDSLDDELESEHPDLVHWKQHVTKLESEIITLRKINFSHLTKLNTLETKQVELDSALKSKDLELLNLQSNINEFDSTKQVLDSKYQESSHQVEFLSQQLEQKNTHIHQLTQKLNKSNQENIEYQNLSQSLTHQLKQLEAHIDQLTQTNSELKEQKDQIENKLHQQDSMLELFALEMAQSKLNLKDLEMYVGSQSDKIPWVDSQLVTKCTKCQSKFTMVNRKHHCRRDGKVYCNNCTRFRWTLPSDPKPSRICEDCYLELTSSN